MTVDITSILQFSRRHGSTGESLFQNWLHDKVVELGYKPAYDGIGNMWVELASPKEYPFLFVSHVDTVHGQDGTVKLMHYTVAGQSMIGLANKDMGCLGADDGCGVYANLKMMEAGIKGTYLFTRGEEGGAIGAEYAIAHKADVLKQFQLCIEVDREGTAEIITENCTGKGASTEFATALADQLMMGHVPSKHGIFTDIAFFNELIPECVNISAGYDRQHTSKERLNITYLEKLVKALVKVDWKALPIKRDTEDVGDVYTYPPHMQNHMMTPYGEEWEGYNVNKSKFSLDFEAMEEYAWVNPQRIASYLTAMGVTVAEVESHWNEGDIPF